MKQPDKSLTALVGTNVFVRTVTLYHVGKVIDVTPGFITLADCSWVADTGRFGVALATGTLNETELFPNDVHVSIGSIIDITAWTHNLPTASK